MALLSNVVVISLNSIVVLTPNGQFLDCAAIAFNERYNSSVLRRWRHTAPAVQTVAEGARHMPRFVEESGSYWKLLNSYRRFPEMECTVTLTNASTRFAVV